MQSAALGTTWQGQLATRQARGPAPFLAPHTHLVRLPVTLLCTQL